MIKVAEVMTKKVFTAHAPLPLAKKLDEIAGRTERPLGWIVKQALADWVDREEQHRHMTLEALASVDAGRLIEHENVVAWAQRLGETRAESLIRKNGAMTGRR